MCSESDLEELKMSCIYSFHFTMSFYAFPTYSSIKKARVFSFEINQNFAG